VNVVSSHTTRWFFAVFAEDRHWTLSSQLSTYVSVFLVVSFLLAFPPISYIHSSCTPFVLHNNTTCIHEINIWQRRNA
jgi:hypothetical protein